MTEVVENKCVHVERFFEKLRSIIDILFLLNLHTTIHGVPGLTGLTGLTLKTPNKLHGLGKIC